MVRIEIEGRGVLIAGPLEDIARRFEDELVRRGFTRKSLMNQLRLLAHLSRWLQAQGIAVGELTAGQVEVFLAERRRTHGPVLAKGAWPDAGMARLRGRDPGRGDHRADGYGSGGVGRV